MQHHQSMDEVFDAYRLEERVWRRGRNAIACVALGGWTACAAGLATDPKRFYFSYLAGFVFWVTILLGGLFFVMLQHVTGAAWSVTMRRFAENLMMALPWGLLLFVPVALGLGQLYPWADAAVVAASPLLQGKHGYLNQTWFTLRTCLYFALWTIWSVKLYRHSLAQDRKTSLESTRAAARWSAAGLIMLIATAYLAGVDWLMALEPQWYSSIFGIYVYAGGALSFIALLIVVLAAFRRADVLRYSVHREHYHDLGKWLFGLTVFWAYIGFSQYLLIWYANLPEETSWFRHRSEGGWGALALILAAGNFLAPFLLLLSRPAKRSLRLLAGVAAWMLLMHYIDIYWMAMPAFTRSGPRLHWLDAATLAAVGASFALAFWWNLRRHALAPLRDARFERSLEFRNL